MQRETMQCHTAASHRGRGDGGRLSEGRFQVHAVCGDEGLNSLSEVRGPVPCRCWSGSGTSRCTLDIGEGCMKCLRGTKGVLWKCRKVVETDGCAADMSDEPRLLV